MACLQGPYGKTWHAPRSHTRKGKQSGRNLGHMLLLLGSVAGVLLGSWAKARLDSSNQVVQGFGKLGGGLI